MVFMFFTPRQLAKLFENLKCKLYGNKKRVLHNMKGTLTFKNRKQRVY